jgi:hypothetical protein
LKRSFDRTAQRPSGEELTPAFLPLRPVHDGEWEGGMAETQSRFGPAQSPKATRLDLGDFAV